MRENMILDEIVAAKRKRLEKQKELLKAKDLEKSAYEIEREERKFSYGLKKEGLSLIGEFKKASPSMGEIQSKVEFKERIEQYNMSVDAISCLTEQDYFHGSIEDLKKIRKNSDLPILRKDFIIDSYQILEARVIGADAILLIAAILEKEKIKSYLALARELKLDVLLEVHNRKELELALETGADIIGINNRNLKDFTIQLDTTKYLAKFVPEDKVLVSESGICRTEDILFLKEAQVDAFLVGRAFMEAECPREVAEEWKGIYHLD